MKPLLILSSALMLLCITGIAEAQQRVMSDTRAYHIHELAVVYDNELDLSDTQKQEIARIRAEYRREVRQRQERLRGDRNARADMRAQRQTNRTEMMDQIREVLTPEQKRQLQQIREERTSQRQEMHAYMTEAYVHLISDDIGLDDEKSRKIADIVTSHQQNMRETRMDRMQAAEGSNRREMQTKRAQMQSEMQQQIREVLTEDEFEAWQEQWEELMPVQQRRGERMRQGRQN